MTDHPDTITVAKCHPFRGDNFYITLPGSDRSGVEYIRADVSAARIADLERQLAEARDKLEGFTDEALLLALIHRNPPSKAPRSRSPHDQDSVIGIGKDHHCYITFQDVDLAALLSLKGPTP